MINYLLIIQLLFTIVNANDNCNDLVRFVLQNNTPEFVFVPDVADINTFTTSRLVVNFHWDHIDRLLNKSCVHKYLIEFGPYNNNSEHESNDAEISPPLDPETVNYSTNLDDNCNVYSVQLLVIVEDQDMIISDQRLFWPAAHRSNVEHFSEGIVITWPPRCAYLTQNWQIQVCKTTPTKTNCSQLVNSQGDSPIHIQDLSSCSIFQLNLLLNGMKNIWTFNDVRTLPKSDFHVDAGYRSLQISVNQFSCHPLAVVEYWKVTHCKHIMVDTTNEEFIHFDQGSGDSQHIDDEDYYYDNTKDRFCITDQHTITQKDGRIIINNLDICTLYSVDLTPVNEMGTTLQPEEQYGTIHSTLCNPSEPFLNKDNKKPFWFDDGTQMVKSVESPPSNTMSLSHVLLGIALGILMSMVVGLILWMKYNNYQERRISSTPKRSMEEKSSAKLALLAT